MRRLSSVLAAVLLAGAALLAGHLATAGAADPPAPTAADGERVFREQGCYGCHTVGIVGTPIATDLSKIGQTRNAGYLLRWLKDPREQRPTSHMPKIALSDAEAAALAAFLAAQR